MKSDNVVILNMLCEVGDVLGVCNKLCEVGDVIGVTEMS